MQDSKDSTDFWLALKVFFFAPSYLFLDSTKLYNFFKSNFQCKKIAMKMTLILVECCPFAYSHILQRPGKPGLGGTWTFWKSKFPFNLFRGEPRTREPPVNLSGAEPKIKLAPYYLVGGGNPKQVKPLLSCLLQNDTKVLMSWGWVSPKNKLNPC